MTNGFSLQDALEVLEDDKNSTCITMIRERLERGELFSTIFRTVIPPGISAYFDGFSLFLPFLDSLQIALELYRKEKKERQILVKGLLYPFGLLIATGGGVFLFSAMIMPAMLGMMRQFEADTAGYERLLSVLQGMFTIFLLLAFAAGCAAFYVYREKKAAMLYDRISSRFPDSFVSAAGSQQFCRFYLECIRHGVPTQRALRILSSLTKKPVVSFIAASLDRQLSQGTDMQKAFQSSRTESRLKRMFRIAVYSSDSEKMLEGYLAMAAVRNEKRIRRFTRILQLVCYGMIAVILVSIYQILLMPVSVIQTL